MSDPLTDVSLPYQSRQRVRQNLQLSQRESFSSALMTGSYDQYVNAFAIWLGASTIALGWLNALPPLLGGCFQIVAVWLGFWFSRHGLIVAGVVINCIGLGVLQLAIWPGAAGQPLIWLLLAAVLCHAGANLVQPHWRAMMGELVPDRLRGRFFGRRTRIAMLTSFITFVCAGIVLNGFERLELAWIGFVLLFGTALVGRLLSARYLARMHDPQETLTTDAARTPVALARLFRQLWREQGFRRFIIFMAGLQCFVALSAPFFAVYMLRDLQFSYLDFTLNTAASILVQFIMLPFWGRVCDQKGNRYVMALCSIMIPTFPVLWLISDSFWYLLVLQMLGGFAWSGFSLASANYLYDFRPRRSSFTAYAALQSLLVAFAVCAGSLAGGYLIDLVPQTIDLFNASLAVERPVAAIFVLSSLLRAAIVIWYMPSAPELRVQRRGRVRDLVFRIAKFTPTTGVALDVIHRRYKQRFKGMTQDSRD